VLVAVGKELVFGAFDRVGLVALGYPVRSLDLLLLLLIEVTVVTSVPAVGTILSVALVVAPAATARLWCDRVIPMTVLAAGLGMAAGTSGLALSQAVDVAAGPAVVLVACGFFVLSLLAAPRHGLFARIRDRSASPVLSSARLVTADRRGREIEHVPHLIDDAVRHTREGRS
jgi:manganese/iron transport system permease protein